MGGEPSRGVKRQGTGPFQFSTSRVTPYGVGPLHSVGCGWQDKEMEIAQEE